jgi:hypothetical protein
LVDLLEAHAMSLESLTPAQQAHTTEVVVELPRFAVFGASPLAAGSATPASKDALSAHNVDQPRTVKELIVVPFSNAARAPQNHRSEESRPSGLDARWMGLAGALALVGLLLVGASLAAMRASTAQRGQVIDESGAPYGDAPPPVASSPRKSKAAPERERLLKPVRKTSNLPA